MLEFEHKITKMMTASNTDKEHLLQLQNDVEQQKSPTRSSVVSRSTSSSMDKNGSNFGFKLYVIASMTVIWTSYTLMIRYTRSSTSKDKLYFATTVVLLSECVKLSISLLVLFLDHQMSIEATKHVLIREFFDKPKELLKMSVPSLMYALQNNLDFVALSNLDAGVYQVTTQLKVVTTAMFMVGMLGRHYSRLRWLAIFGLTFGVALVQLDAVQNSPPSNATSAASKSTKTENYLVGLSAVLVTCLTAGFAGVYFEKMLKDGSTTPFWIRNIQMYSCGIISASFGVLLSESTEINEHGFFYGYNLKVLTIIGLLSIGGIYISLVMKHLDNLYKSFASAVSIILVFLASYIIFGSNLGVFFFIGATVVCVSIVTYNSVPE